MLTQRPSGLLAVMVVATQILGPSVLWAAELERGARVEAAQHVVVTGAAGGELQAQGPNAGESPRTLRFRDRVASGERLSIGPDTIAEVLVGHQALVTAQGPSTFRITQPTDGHPVISLEKGELLVAVASSASGDERDVTLETPTARLVTDGGLIRASTEGGFKQTMPPLSPRQLQVVLASYTMTAEPLLAAAPSTTEFFQIVEGRGTVTAAQATDTAVALESGQGVHITNGALDTPFVPPASTNRVPSAAAVAQHANTPALGAQHLAELQMQQAVALQQVLLGASESTSDEVQGQNASRNAIISTLNANLGSGTSSSTDALLASLFGSGNPYAQGAQNPQDRGGAAYGGANNQGFETTQGDARVSISGGNGLLVFTKKDPLTAVWVGPPNENCLEFCSLAVLKDPSRVALKSQPSISSNFTATKELLLVGGTPNVRHGGAAPTETLVVRGASPASGATVFSNVAATPVPKSVIRVPPFTVPPRDGLFIESGPFGPFANDAVNFDDFRPLKKPLIAQNSTFVVETASVGTVNGIEGGTLSQYSNRADSLVLAHETQEFFDRSFVDGAITATGPSVVLKGGVTLDHGTAVTMGTTAATNNYFANAAALNPADAKFSGSLISVLTGPNGPVSLTINDRALAVFDGSSITGGGGNKALLSVLDSRLIGPGSVPLIDVDAAGGAPPSIQNVTSAFVVRSTVPVASLDQALLVATAPLLALTNGTMTTTSHFADLAGNKNQALNLQANALVGLNAASLAIQSGHLLNLNAASATISGYLFSLANGSTLSINNGLLFSLTNGSNLNLNANAFGVFGAGTNMLNVTNGLCGAGAACGQLVNSANAPFNGPNGPIRVAGTSQNLVLPNNFNVFAAQNPALQKVNIGATDALFKVDTTSTLTINGTPVKK